MRGNDTQQSELFSYLSPEARVPQDHPLRKIRKMADEALREISAHLEELYSSQGRPSVAPERLLRTLLLQMLFSVRSERRLMEELDYNLLFRWFVGMNMDEPVWDVTVFTKNRDRLLEGAVAELFFSAVLRQARREELLSDDHFTVDGTLIEAWAGKKSYQLKEKAPKAGSGSRGELLLSDRYESSTDPEARMFKKSLGGEAKLSYLGHLLTENRHGLIVATQVTRATTKAEHEAALEMVDRLPRKSRRVTLGADKGYDQDELIRQLRRRKVTPHVAPHTKRRCAIDRRTTRHRGYEISQRKRKRVEEAFGWMKTIALMRKVRHRGRRLVEWMFTLAASACNLVRMARLKPLPT
jgi:transposase